MKPNHFIIPVFVQSGIIPGLITLVVYGGIQSKLVKCAILRRLCNNWLNL